MSLSPMITWHVPQNELHLHLLGAVLYASLNSLENPVSRGQDSALHSLQSAIGHDRIA